ncbi:MAG TPA: NADH:flavin oxidoreductase, partial [Chloroflexota bacterium]|nr:NADH:flavin oxidoreductase [Chloroflexota bacterium]
MIIKRVATFKRPADFQAYLAELGIDLACDDTLVVGSASPLWQPFEVYGRRVGNRWATQPMEGWDGTTDGGVTENVLRRWRRFGESGAKLIWGGEAMAIRPEGRANPNQLIINEEHAADLALLRETLLRSHQEHFGRVDDLIVGFQLTHSGRYCRPFPDRRPCPRVAYRHPILDARVGVTSDAPVIPDEEIPSLVDDYVQAARVARRAGADFVDVKHCHGYLLHEFLSARTRPGPYGGSFENRTRLLREI